MVSQQIYKQIEKDAFDIMMSNPQIDDSDAVILSSVSMFIHLFDDFVEDTLQVKYSDEENYKAEVSVHEFVEKRNPLMYLVTDVGISVAHRYPNVARSFFIDRVEWFKTEIKNIGLTGNVKVIYDLQAEFHMFHRLVEGGVLTSQLEQALRTFEGLTPDIGRLYMSGIKNLGSKAKTGRKVFDSLVQIGKSVPMTLKEIADETGKSRTTIKRGIDEILDNAGHLIRVGQRQNLEVYHIPEEIRRLHFN